MSKRQNESENEVSFERVVTFKVTKRNHGDCTALYFEARVVNEDGTPGEVVIKGTLQDPTVDKNSDGTFMVRATDPNADYDCNTNFAGFFKAEHKVDTHVPETAGSLTPEENEDEWTTVA